MFDKTRYVIEEKLVSSFFGFIFPLAFRETYGIKDVNGNLLGYVKKQRLRSNFWFEGKGKTRMGEILSFKKGYRVYNAQNQLRATIRKAPTKKGRE